MRTAAVLLAILLGAASAGAAPPPPSPAAAPHAPAPPPSAPHPTLLGALEAHAPRHELVRATAHEASADLEGFAARRYGAAGAPALAELRTIEPRFGALVADPGIAMRTGAFKAFVEAHPALRDGDPWAARQAFAASLGTRVVFRALALTPAELEKVKVEGLGSQVVRAPSPRAVTDATTLTLRRQVDARVQPGQSKPVDALVSVADTPRVATAVANAISMSLRSRGPLAGGRDARVYLFKARVPAIDVIAEEESSPILEVPAGKKSVELHLGWIDRAGRPHETAQPLASAKAESFVLYGIDAAEIESTTEVPAAQAGLFRVMPTGTPTIHTRSTSPSTPARP